MPKTLNKSQRIKSKQQIADLFENGKNIIAYPLRICYLWNMPTEGQTFENKIMVSVPKKLFKRAVKRNLLKRRIREAYRLNQHLLEEKNAETGQYIQIAFTYIAQEPLPFDKIQNAVIKGLNKIRSLTI